MNLFRKPRSYTLQANKDYEIFMRDNRIGPGESKKNTEFKGLREEEAKKRFIMERKEAYKFANQGGKSLKITRETALKMAKKFNINLKVVPIQEFQKGIQIELEHGKMLGKVTNVTQNNIQMTTRIAIAHLIEDPRYYKHLEILEKKRETYWKSRTKPNIFQ
jgi:hypothetical protein